MDFLSVVELGDTIDGDTYFTTFQYDPIRSVVVIAIHTCVPIQLVHR